MNVTSPRWLWFLWAISKDLAFLFVIFELMRLTYNLF